MEERRETGDAEGAGVGRVETGEGASPGVPTVEREAARLERGMLSLQDCV